MTDGEWIETDVPQRMDRLPWSGWHWLVVTALGVTWILDGLETTIAGALGGVLTHRDTLGLTIQQVDFSSSCYLIGAVTGALVFGYCTDRLGRKKLFYVTLLVYLCATAATAFSWNFASYAFFRALTGAGIGGEYAAINSAIDELIPARRRGQVDLIINSTYWIGAALGFGGDRRSCSTRGTCPCPAGLAFCVRHRRGAGAGRCCASGTGCPESPRWLMIHGRNDEAERIVADVERKVTDHPESLPPPEGKKTRIRQRTHTPWKEIWHAVAHEHRKSSILGLSLMIAQAFFYNAIFFTAAQVLEKYYGVPAGKASWYLFAFAVGNAFGPVVLGGLFDSVGRKPMIAGTYALSGILLAITGWLFERGMLTANTQTLAWTIIFFIASSAASAAYLTVSEIFPLEIRGMAIAVFYAAGTLFGGAAAPSLFGHLISMPGRGPLFFGYGIGAALMIGAAAVELWIGVKAEGQSLESIAAPLSSRK